MTKIKQIYKCNLCGNVVAITHQGAGELVCCGEPMELLEEKTEEQAEGQEKHLPVVEKTPEKLLVKVGSVPHPMEEDHYIKWIELTTDKGSHRHFLSVNDQPTAEFKIDSSEKIKVRVYCNLHGLWSVTI